ncbi:hypothetical protein SASPL_114796 [Salvia splendens]|uniref:Uncharacterized protein n=1 Tax=Salvia splendens TaxID=180675 RepID=A0A8X9A115_SALSN|nr:hypothetical protein SASPL_114796 [Salvia splendens]
MSLSSCSDCFSDLLCGKATSSIISSGGGYFSLEYSSNFDSQASDATEYISRLLENERDLAGISICCAVDEPIDASVRALSSSEIINQSDPRSPQKRAGWSRAFQSEDLAEEEMQRCFDENEMVIREIRGGRRWMVTAIATAAAVIFYFHAHKNH